MQAQWREARRHRHIGGVVAGLGLAALSFSVARATPKGDNVHRADAACAACHTAEHATIAADPQAARTTLLAPDVENRCYACHDEGPSHHTGIRPKKPVPESLPLSSSGLITCNTCHFVHGDQNPFGDFLRINNSRGGLCLTCHELSELQ